MVYKDFQDLKLSNLGMGCMRLPVVGGNDAVVDQAAVEEMVALAMARGVNYYDTAWAYHAGTSELAIGKALAADSVGTIISSFVGTSTVASYVESASGIAQGGRTGLTAITVAGLFALALLFSPIISLVPACATAPALVIVGAIMMSDVRHINFTDFTEGFPAFLTIIMMPMTYSIASGIGFAFISYPLIKLLTGRARDLNICTWVIALLFLINFIILS